MNPQEQFCHNQHCWAYGRKGEEHIVIHSHKERRYRCKRCGRTFSQTKGTALYRLHKPQELVFVVLTLLAYGSPIQAIVAAFGLDERTVSRWQREAGSQCRRVHEHLVEAGNVELSQVQADELRVRVVGGIMWLATALEVKSRLWLGGVVRVHRDRQLIRALLWRIKECGSVAQILLCTDGLACYAKQALLIFREALRNSGRVGRPRLILPEGVMVARVKKRYERRRVVEVLREVVRGTEGAVQERLMETQRSVTALINTAYVERLNATFRARLAPLVRRSRAGVHEQGTLEAGMWLMGTCYNFLWAHRSLRQECGGGGGGEEPSASKWIERTPAQAAGLTDHRWTMEELMRFVVMPARMPKRRGRRPKWLLEAARAA
jgi:transposase-like protein